MEGVQFFNEIEQRALDRLFRDVSRSFGVPPEKLEEAKDSICSEVRERPWKSNPGYEGVDFNDLAKSCAYIKRFAGCHCALTRHCTLVLLYQMPYLHTASFFSRSPLNVVSVGGGAGNDLVGFCSAISAFSHLLISMKLTVVDKKGGWQQVFTKLFALVSHGRYGSTSNMLKHILCDTKFIESDLAEHASSRVVSEADVILMTKVLSWTPQQQKRNILQNIFSSMKSNAIFLFIDNESTFVSQMAESFGMLLLLKSHNPSKFLYHSSFDNYSITKSTFELCVVQKIGAPRCF